MTETETAVNGATRSSKFLFRFHLNCAILRLQLRVLALADEHVELQVTVMGKVLQEAGVLVEVHIHISKGGGSDVQVARHEWGEVWVIEDLPKFRHVYQLVVNGRLVCVWIDWIAVTRFRRSGCAGQDRVRPLLWRHHVLGLWEELDDLIWRRCALGWNRLRYRENKAVRNMMNGQLLDGGLCTWIVTCDSRPFLKSTHTQLPVLKKVFTEITGGEVQSQLCDHFERCLSHC